jgi:hypothetical protein
MQKTYKQYSVKYYNNDNQLKKEYVYADNHKQAMGNIMDKYDVYKVNIASVALLKTVTL